LRPSRHRRCRSALVSPIAQSSQVNLVGVGHLAGGYPRLQAIKDRLRQVIKRNPNPARRTRVVIAPTAGITVLGAQLLGVANTPPIDRPLGRLRIKPRRRSFRTASQRSCSSVSRRPHTVTSPQKYIPSRLA